MNGMKRGLGLTMMTAILALTACDAAGPTGPLSSVDALFAAPAKKKTTQVEPTTTEITTLVESFEILTRTEPLAKDVSASKVIGRAGGYIASLEGGFGIWVPEGALRKDVNITVTALAGDKLAFDFQPHGLKFRAPVRIGILKGAGVGEESSVGVYYDGDPKNNPKFLEFFTVFDSAGFTMLETTHFSGYALASGSRSNRVLSSTSF